MSSRTARTVQWAKGHGTENDFVLLLDPDGQAYSDLDAGMVRLLCDRRRGVGADGVLRVVRADAIEDGKPYLDQARWFMDFRNADGSTGEMCGNGVRVFARFLASTGFASASGVVPVATRAGLRPVRWEADDRLTVDMGKPEFPPSEGLTITANGHTWPATAVDMGNPHAVAYVDDLDDPGALVEQPSWSPAEVFPKGVNIEFVVRRGPRHYAMRVHERGVGETRSCGTGTCAVAAVSVEPSEDRPVTYTIDVPGGSLDITFREDGHLEMTGPAVLTSRGTIQI
ncbi:diaminopimelate epimerase [Flindersiella endophytica]